MFGTEFPQKTRDGSPLFAHQRELQVQPQQAQHQEQFRTATVVMEIPARPTAPPTPRAGLAFIIVWTRMAVNILTAVPDAPEGASYSTSVRVRRLASTMSRGPFVDDKSVRAGLEPLCSLTPCSASSRRIPLPHRRSTRLAQQEAPAIYQTNTLTCYDLGEPARPRERRIASMKRRLASAALIACALALSAQPSNRNSSRSFAAAVTRCASSQR